MRYDVLKSKFLLIRCLIVGITFAVIFESSGRCDYYYHPYYHTQSAPIISLTLDPQENLNCDLRIAAREGNVTQMLHLIDLGAKINAVSPDGKSALMYSAETCDIQVGRILLSKGARLELRDKFGRTALMFASIGSCSSMISLMTRFSGSDIRARDKSGRTALDYANDGASLYEEGPPVESVHLLEKALQLSALKTRKTLSSWHSQHQHSKEPLRSDFASVKRS